MKFIGDYIPEINVTNKINGEENEWKQGDIILISSGTASGKSYFVRNRLTQLAEDRNRQILFIFNRVKLHQQNLDILQQEFNLRIKTATYQEIEQKILSGKGYDFSPYTYIVCDECHYFTTDSAFNDTSDISLNAILKLGNHIRIFMSATGSTLFKYIKKNYSLKLKSIGNKIWSNYQIPKDYSNIASLSFYTEQESIERFIQDKFHDPNIKIVYFCKSVKKAAELHEKYPDSVFMCSKNDVNKTYHKYLNENAIITIGDKVTFNKKFLFTTKVLDNGFDLKDPDIKLIICDEFDIDTMLQCIGRKRFRDKDDKVHIVLLNHSNKVLNGYMQSYKKKIDEVNALSNGGIDEWNKIVGRFGKSSSHITNDNPTEFGKRISKKTASLVKYLKAVSDYELVGKMLSNNKELNKFREMEGKKKESDAYVVYIMNLFKKNHCYILESIYDEEDLSDYLNSIVGKRLYKHEQKEIIEKFDIRDYRNRLQKDIEILNTYLKSNGYEYTIGSFKDNVRSLEDGSDNPNRGKHYWKVTKY